MTANTQEAGIEEQIREAFTAGRNAGYTSGWNDGFDAAKLRANLPLPQGGADKVDAERLDWIEANPKRIKRSTGYLGSPDSWAFTDHSGRGMDAASLRAAIDAARLTPGGQKP